MIVIAYSKDYKYGISQIFEDNYFKNLKEFIDIHKELNIEISINKENYNKIKKTINLKIKNNKNLVTVKCIR